MKKPNEFWRSFWRGFWGALIVMLAVAGCLWGMRIAENNTKAIGFAQSMAFIQVR